MKRPAFQFYPADWRKDPGIQSLSFEERGVWFELLCIMHESEQPGKLLLGGIPFPTDRLARLLGLSPSYLEVIITSLITLNVASICDETGALMNRRMVRDFGKTQELAATRSESGKKGGNPAFEKGRKNPYYDKQKDNPDHNQDNLKKDNQKITSSSSSSTSTSVEEPPTPLGGNEEQFSDEESNPPEPPTPAAKDRCLPETWKRMSQGDRKRTRVLSNSPTMIRIGRFFGRKGDTLWTVAETVALLSIKPTEDEMADIEKYYLAMIPKDEDYRRRDLDTLLNNWPKELDRAKTYAANLHRDSR